jgi:hypothetical protein
MTGIQEVRRAVQPIPEGDLVELETLDRYRALHSWFGLTVSEAKGQHNKKTSADHAGREVLGAGVPHTKPGANARNSSSEGTAVVPNPGRADLRPEIVPILWRMLDLLPVGIVLLDACDDFRIIYSNPAHGSWADADKLRFRASCRATPSTRWYRMRLRRSSERL